MLPSIANALSDGAYTHTLEHLYGADAAAQPPRILAALRSFESLFGQRGALHLFSAPGRTEIAGNHTDHQNGRVLAAAVTLDMLAVAAENRDGVIRVQSGGYPVLKINVHELSARKHERGSSHALVRGVADGLHRAGYRLGGFDAFIVSSVPKGSGLSSSAAYSVLVGSILSGLYNGGAIPPLALALAAQHAENAYFGKPSGLMDQLACAEGGFSAIDFADPQHPVVDRIPCDLTALGWALAVVSPGGSHAKLTPEYAAIPAEMNAVAACFNQPHLSTVSESAFYAALPSVREAAGDRAVLRAMHFFGENARVPAMAAALKAADMPEFARFMNASGDSSLKLLQNIWPSNAHERSLALALALAERQLAGRGAWRVHGGGFAGTILSLMPLEQLAGYTAAMERVFGQGCCRRLNIRPAGGLEILPG